MEALTLKIEGQKYEYLVVTMEASNRYYGCSDN